MPKNPMPVGQLNSIYDVNARYYPIVKPTGAAVSLAATAKLTPAQFAGNLNNTGAAGMIVLTLPDANLTLNKVVRMYLTAAQIVRFAPIATQGIYVAGLGVVNKYVQIAGVIGNYIDLHSNGTSYTVLNYSGVVTKEP